MGLEKLHFLNDVTIDIVKSGHIILHGRCIKTDAGITKIYNSMKKIEGGKLRLLSVDYSSFIYRYKKPDPIVGTEVKISAEVKITKI